MWGGGEVGSKILDFRLLDWSEEKQSKIQNPKSKI
jgi:hypothetical protein